MADIAGEQKAGAKALHREGLGGAGSAAGLGGEGSAAGLGEHSGTMRSPGTQQGIWISSKL